jgi:response regulator RpfG family c-di-GMP phosphodiesterase
VLERVSCFEALAPLAAAHHERLDGSGYPSGLDEDEALATIRVCPAGWTRTPTLRRRR